MIYAFREDSQLATSGLMDDIFALRHSVFVEKMNWEVLRRPNGLERDEFDHTDAVHMALVRNDKLLAYSRILPTTRPHLLSDVYPELMHGKPLPRAPDVWEWTRLCAINDPETGLATPVRAMMVAVAEISLILRASRFIAQGEPGWVGRLNRLGWAAKPIGITSHYGGLPVAPLEARATIATIEVSRRRLGVHGDVLDVSSLEINIPVVA